MILNKDYRDIVGGGVLLLAGSAMALHASGTLDLGSLRRMGPGLFPTGVGVVLALFGLAIMIPAFFRPGTGETIEWRSAGAVLASVVAFAVLVRPLGLLPAIAALVVIASLAEQKLRPLTTLVMIAVLCAAAYAIFRLGLGLPLVMFRSPF